MVGKWIKQTKTVPFTDLYDSSNSYLKDYSFKIEVSIGDINLYMQ